MSKNLSQIVADLFASVKGIEDLSSKSQPLRAELRKAIQNEDAIFGKLSGLLESFRQIIPDEKQRYLAALQALSTTAKLTRQEIVTGISGQIEELKVLEKSMLPAMPGWRDELKGMEARSRALQAELSKLREKIAQLESEEKTLQTSIAAREKDLELAEKTIKELFADISAELTSVRKKVEELPSEAPAVQPSPPAPQTAPQKALVKSTATGEKKEGGEQVQPAPAPKESKYERKCPMCGGPFNLLELEKKWQCYTCAHEEAAGEQTVASQKIDVPAAPAPGEMKYERKCPMCGGPFNLLELEKKWQCYTCAFEEPAAGGAQGGSGPVSAQTPAPAVEPTSPPAAKPVEFEMPEDQHLRKEPAVFAKEPVVKQKACPSCRKTMYWYPDDKAWRCPSCYYERRI